MKKIWKNVLIIMFCILFSGNVNIVSAQNVSTYNINDGKIVKIITKHRIYHGRQQHRRFNASTGNWVDPDWIDD